MIKIINDIRHHIKRRKQNKAQAQHYEFFGYQPPAKPRRLTYQAKP